MRLPNGIRFVSVLGLLLFAQANPSEVRGQTYDWVASAWSSCSAACGGGTQTRTVVCQSSGGATVQVVNTSTGTCIGDTWEVIDVNDAAKGKFKARRR